MIEMWNVSSSIAPVQDCTSQARNAARTEASPPIVTLTSAVTETLRPTEIITEGTTIYTPSVVLQETTVTQVDQNTYSEAAPTETTTTSYTETTSLEASTQSTTIMEPSSTTCKPSTEPTMTSTWLSEQVPEPSAPTTWESSSSCTSTIGTIIPASYLPLDSTVFAWSGALTTASSSTFLVLASTKIASYTSTSQTSSPSSTPIASVAGDSSSLQNSSTDSGSDHKKVGAIVGGTIGAAAAIAVLVLACLCLVRRRKLDRHRRHKHHKHKDKDHKRKHSKQRLLHGHNRDSISSFNGTQQNHFSEQFPFPPTREISVPAAPVFPAQRSYLDPPPVRPDPALAASNQDLSLDRMYLRGESPPNYSEDPEKDAALSPVSPIIEISPPSRSVSNYSRCSWEADDRSHETSDSSFPNTRQGSTYYPGESAITLPDSGSLTGNFLGIAKTRDSTRSDPFDLETSHAAGVHDEPLPPPPAASYWRFGF